MTIRRASTRLALLLALSLSSTPLLPADGAAQRIRFVVTRVPASVPAGNGPPIEYGEKGRIVLVEPGGKERLLTPGFDSAADPAISPDGLRVLFAGKRAFSDDWNIFETDPDGGTVRQITHGMANCRHPVHLGSLYTLDSPEPFHQIAFVSDRAGEIDPVTGRRVTGIYSCGLDGLNARRLTFNPYGDTDPAILPDGRLLFSSRQRLERPGGRLERVSLFVSQTDGLDYAIYSGDEGLPIKRTPAVLPDGRVLFVERETPRADGAGSLGSVNLRRNLHSYAPVTRPADGLFLSPSPLADGRLLVSWRDDVEGADFGVYRLDPATGVRERLLDRPGTDEIQAVALEPRPVADDRSTGVSETVPTGKLYCLDAYDSDLPGHGTLAGVPLRLRVLEGMPRLAGDPERNPPPGPAARFLGEVDVEADGSFNVEVPANVPIRLQLVDAEGLALRTCGWIWVRNKETRGCIGCHEDGERTPDNRFVKALGAPSVDLNLPPRLRRTIDFQRDVRPILASRCRACHDSGSHALALDDGTAALPMARGSLAVSHAYLTLRSHVTPGVARTSPLIWHLMGGDTRRPWDDRGPGTRVPAPATPLPGDEMRTLVEWIDLGALWNGLTNDSGRQP